MEGNYKLLWEEKEGYPVWGSLIKFADLLAAYYEAYYTLRHGLRNEELESALKNLKWEISEHPLVRDFPKLKELVGEGKD